MARDVVVAGGMPRHDPITIDPALCKACGICVALCTREALVAAADGIPTLSEPEQCTLCRRCELHCPEFAIRSERSADEGILEEEVA